MEKRFDEDILAALLFLYCIYFTPCRWRSWPKQNQIICEKFIFTDHKRMLIKYRFVVPSPGIFFPMSAQALVFQPQAHLWLWKVHSVQRRYNFIFSRSLNLRQDTDVLLYQTVIWSDSVITWCDSSLEYEDTCSLFFSRKDFSSSSVKKKMTSTNKTLSLLFLIKYGVFDSHILTQSAVLFFQYLMLLSLGHKLSLTLCKLLLDVKILLFYIREKNIIERLESHTKKPMVINTNRQVFC